MDRPAKRSRVEEEGEKPLTINDLPDELLEDILRRAAGGRGGREALQHTFPWVCRKWQTLVLRIYPHFGATLFVPEQDYDYGRIARAFREELRLFGPTTRAISTTRRMFSQKPRDARWIPEIDRWCPNVESMDVVFDWMKAHRAIKLRFPMLKHARHYCPHYNTITLFNGTDRPLPCSEEWRKMQAAKIRRSTAYAN